MIKFISKYTNLYENFLSEKHFYVSLKQISFILYSYHLNCNKHVMLLRKNMIFYLVTIFSSQSIINVCNKNINLLQMHFPNTHPIFISFFFSPIFYVFLQKLQKYMRICKCVFYFLFFFSISTNVYILHLWHHIQITFPTNLQQFLYCSTRQYQIYNILLLFSLYLYFYLCFFRRIVSNCIEE